MSQKAHTNKQKLNENQWNEKTEKNVKMIGKMIKFTIIKTNRT